MKKIFLGFYILFFINFINIGGTKKQFLNTDNILLIINFNHPFYDCISFLKELYKPYFKNIVFYGEKEHKDVHVVQHRFGWYAYKSLADAMRRYPEYDGYLMTHDDAILNPWNFGRLDLKKIWFVDGARTASIHAKSVPCEEVDGKPIMWTWWEMEAGQAVLKNAYPKLPEKYRKQNEINVGGQDMVDYCYADVFYIPGRLREEFCMLSDFFAQEKLFLEIAIPTICNALDDKRNWEILKGYTWWWWFPLADGNGALKKIKHEFIRIGMGQYSMIEKYSPMVDFVHPIKLSDKKGCEFVKVQFAKFGQ